MRRNPSDATVFRGLQGQRERDLQLQRKECAMRIKLTAVVVMLLVVAAMVIAGATAALALQGGYN
jgi:hypothetical protein